MNVLAGGSVAATTILCAALCGQGEVPRKRAGGVVRDLAGRPWQGAEVHLYSRAVPALVAIRDVDHVVVKTDERGRFRAALIPGRPYSAWACSTPARGSFRVSQRVERVFSGRSVRLREAEGRRIAPTVTIRGLEAWKQAAPFRIVVRCHETENVATLPLRLDDGKVVLPPFPGDGCFLEIRDAQGAPMHSAFVPLTESRAALHAEFLGRKYDARNPVVEVLPPVEIAIELFDDKGKERVAARVAVFRDLAMARAPWEKVGVTDAAGRATIRVPGRRLDSGAIVVGRLNLLVRGAAISDCVALAAGPSFGAGKSGSIRFKTRQGVALSGRLMLDAKRPAARTQLVAYGTIRTSSGGTNIGVGPHVFTTDRDGRFVVAGRSTVYAYRLCAVPTRQQRVELQRGSKFPLATELMIATGKAAADVDLGEVRLDRMQAFDVSVLEPDGAPADRPLVLASRVAAKDVACYPVRMCGDARGRVRILLPAGNEYLLAAGTNEGLLWHRLTTGEPVGDPIALPLQVDPRRILRGRVQDGQGRPVADARVQLRRTGMRDVYRVVGQWGTTRMLSKAGTWIDRGRCFGKDPSGYWKYKLWDWFADVHDHAWTDARGQFAIPLTEQDKRPNLRVFAGPPEARVASAQTSVQDASEPVRITLDVAK